MGKKLFVGGLPYETNDAQLKELFGACGVVVRARVIMDKATGRSKGFGFVEMTTDGEAAAATEKLNNSAVGSRRIIVNEARPMEPRPPGGPTLGPGGPTLGPGGPPHRPGGDFRDRKSGFGDRKGGDYDKKGGFGGKRGGKRGGYDYDKKGGGGKGRRDDDGYDGGQ